MCAVVPLTLSACFNLVLQNQYLPLLTITSFSLNKSRSFTCFCFSPLALLPPKSWSLGILMPALSLSLLPLFPHSPQSIAILNFTMSFAALSPDFVPLLPSSLIHFPFSWNTLFSYSSWEGAWNGIFSETSHFWKHFYFALTLEWYVRLGTEF